MLKQIVVQTPRDSQGTVDIVMLWAPTFLPGAHEIALIVGNGGGIWTIEAGSTTSILVQFG